MPMQNRPVGYPLSITDAAVLAKVAPVKIRQFVHAGLLPCLLYRDGAHTEWFNAEDIREFTQTLRGVQDAGMVERRIHEIGDALLEYLAANPPLAEYDVALAERMPVLARARSGRIHAHVQPDALARWAELHSARRWPAATLEPAVTATLEKLGAVRLRGLTPLTGGGQRWHYWWRLPTSYWSVSPDLESVIEGITAREPDEQVSTRGGTALAEPMQPIDE
jgi:hypothetical protein